MNATENQPNEDKAVCSFLLVALILTLTTFGLGKVLNARHEAGAAEAHQASGIHENGIGAAMSHAAHK